MIKYSLCRDLRSTERLLAPGINIGAEGAPMVAVYSGGQFVGVKPCTGAAGEKFMGFSRSQQLQPVTLAYVEEFTVSGTAGSLKFTSVASTLRLFDVTGNVALAAGDNANANEYELNVNLKDISFNAAQTDHLIRAWYRFSPTLLQARAIQGDVLPGQAAANQYGRVSLIEGGDLYTSEFDTSIDWSTQASVKMAANGLLTGAGGSGVAIASAQVIHCPTPDTPFLGLKFGIAV